MSRKDALLLILVFVAIAQLMGCASATPLAPKALELNRLGVEALAAGDLTTAEARFAVALEYHPRFVEAQVNLGLTELSRGNHARARQLFDRAARINDNLPHPHHGKGALADKEGRGKQAADHYRDALKVDPGFVPARANLGRLYFDAGMYEDARDQFQKLLEVAPKEDAGPAGLVESLWALGRGTEAEDVLRAAEKRLGFTPKLGLLRGRSLLLAGDARRARAVLERVVADPGDGKTSAGAWCALAELADGDADAAERRVDRVLRQDPHDAFATRVLAMILEHKGDPGAQAFRARSLSLARRATKPAGEP